MTASEWATLVLGIVAVIGLPAGGFIYNTLRKSIDALWARHEEMVKAREKSAAELADFKITVTRDYVTRDLLESFEKRMDSNFRELKSDFKAGMEALTRAFDRHRDEEGRK
jgi:hypothetical protein